MSFSIRLGVQSLTESFILVYCKELTSFLSLNQISHHGNSFPAAEFLKLTIQQAGAMDNARKTTIRIQGRFISLILSRSQLN